MLLHNGLILATEVKARWRATKASVTIPRFTMNEVIQHLLLTVSFLLLVVTGFALTYPNLWVFRWLEWLHMTEPVRQVIHRSAGVALIALGGYHLAYLAATRRGHQVLRLLWLRLDDLWAASGNVAYYLGLRRRPPDFDEFDYTEKIEYWALIWGTLVMAVTGVVLWFPESVSRHAPSWIIELSTVVHFYEAVLASLAILIWHGFFVLVHPLNLTMVDGRIELESYAHHHRRPFRRLLLQWSRVRSGALKREQLDVFTVRVLSALEAAGHDPDRVFEDMLTREPELRTWLEGQQPPQT